MKDKWDDFIDDMVKDNTPSKADPKAENLNEIGKKMEEEVKKAFDSASGKKEAAPKNPEPKDPEEEPEENDDVDDMNDEREDN